jgi:hypothetical protein
VHDAGSGVFPEEEFTKAESRKKSKSLICFMVDEIV